MKISFIFNDLINVNFIARITVASKQLLFKTKVELFCYCHNGKIDQKQYLYGTYSDQNEMYPVIHFVVSKLNVNKRHKKIFCHDISVLL